MPASVLIVDDEKNILLTLQTSLQLAGYHVELAANGQVALDVVSARPVDAVLMDVKMPDMDGLTVLAKVMELKPELPVIMMSGHGTIDTAVKATQLGARDFLEKPIARERLLVALRNALKHQAALEELRALRAEHGRYDMVGGGAAMQRIFSLIQRTAPSEGRVLITGENGTGKELIARALHQHSRRKGSPFVKLNCAAVPHELIESELFGHEKGAFTGAVSVRRGKFELAHEGTLFLDEIGDMPQAMQTKLLRVLQEGELERVGGAETIKVDVRVIAATNKNLEREIEAGRFREDLYYRVNVVQIHSPPLRERREDLPALIDTFLREACTRNGRRPLSLSPEALSVMAAYSYPGNVRELRNLVERLAILCEGPGVSGADAQELLPRSRGQAPSTSSEPAPLPLKPLPSPAPPTGFRPRVDRTFREQVEDAERDILQHTLAHTQDNVTEAARLLDLERGHFYKKLKALGIKRGEKDGPPPGNEGG
ncbi:sigma-54-dependent transcriptional regulator [Archangium primigenium]|uniref:sigma-54-dependent transcriptional regulator n=1 Tax=[Archangium] primigenium TaxID=2792470 RepID=UPI0019577CD2|nr:sigma-54 dependent transcriptional regulator [Archangium primigenium]MBM7117931.1 sigma-54-dependent Fis family transcriptional regulator [Archangium primigenium]